MICPGMAIGGFLQQLGMSSFLFVCFFVVVVVFFFLFVCFIFFVFVCFF